ncbi:hypothetical protein ACQP60_07580 [Isoptericola variabilis]|uniref:hypothetical protein n=1 Tax=Isoptericola variabilis TaxID=139208 RepID=UPI003D250747
MTPAAPAPGDEPGDDAASPGTARPEDPGSPARPPRPTRKQVLLRLDPAIHDAVARWAADDLRSVNAQIDLLLRRALKDARPVTTAERWELQDDVRGGRSTGRTRRRTAS